MLRLASYLKKSRHDIFYFRCVIPPDLRPIFRGRAEIKISLKTSERKVAVGHARVLSGKVFALYSLLRAAMSKNNKDFDPKDIQELVIKDTVLPNGVRIGHAEINNEEDFNLFRRFANISVLAEADHKTPAYDKDVRLIDAIAEFIADKSRTWAPGTKRLNVSTLNIFQEIMAYCLKSRLEQIALVQIQLQQIEDYIASLQKLPARRDNKASIAKFLKNPSSTWTTVSPETAFSHLGRIEGFWTWVMDKGYNAYSISFKRLKEVLKAQIAASLAQKRQPFSIAQLQTLFAPNTYLASANRPYRYWSPLIALFTGMRVTEIAQLHLSDIREEEGILYIDINKSAKDKRVKNANSIRTIPIHSALIEIGFEDYIKELRQAGYTYLFPEITHEANGQCGDIVSDWFLDYRRSVGLDGSEVVFHSFRHTVPDRLRAARVDVEMIAVIMGHKSNAGFTRNYGRGYDMAQKKEAIENIKYPGLQLSSLTYIGGQFAKVIAAHVAKRQAQKNHAAAKTARQTRQTKTN